MRRVLLLFAVGIALWAALPADAHEGHEHSGVVVVELQGPIDQRVLDFASGVIEEDSAALIVLRIDSPGVVSGDVSGFVDSLESAKVPVAVWVGPQGARAYGGALQIAVAADYLAVAPGAKVGYALPAIAGSSDRSGVVDVAFGELEDERIVLREGDAPPDFVAELIPSIGQVLAALDGRTIGGFVVDTVERSVQADGTEVVIPVVEVRFLEPGLFTRFLRLSIRPEATFFFLVAGLSLVAFELYAAGVGIVAAVAGLSLFLSAYGLTVLPMRWWAVGAAVIGLGLYTWDFQRIRLALPSLAGTALLLVGGLFITDGAPQITPSSWVVVVVVTGVAAFYLFAMTTVVRSRFSTPTIGREHLVGRFGVAESIFDPEGYLSVDGARWKGRATRAAEIRPGDLLTITEVRGIVLEVDPAGRQEPAPDGPESDEPAAG